MMETKIVQFTAGRGPIECCKVVALVAKKFVGYCKENKIEFEMIHQQPANLTDTFFSISILIKSKNMKVIIEEWEGTILWIGQSPYRKFHKRKNWYIGVTFFEIPSKINWNENDVKFESCRASGPGGQHVNKVATAVRGTHLPSGITVLAADSRSQATNKKLCLERIKEKVAENNVELFMKKQMQQWQEHNELERGNPKKIFDLPFS